MTWWQVTLAVTLGVGWLLAARWNLLMTARPVFPSWGGSTCLAGSPFFAWTQAALAFLGIGGLTGGVLLHLWPSTRALRRSFIGFAAAGVLAAIWVVAQLVFATLAKDLGGYAGCGLS